MNTISRTALATITIMAAMTPNVSANSIALKLGMDESEVRAIISETISAREAAESDMNL